MDSYWIVVGVPMKLASNLTDIRIKLKQGIFLFLDYQEYGHY